MSGPIIADQAIIAVQCVTGDSVVIGWQVFDKHCESDDHHFNVEGSWRHTPTECCLGHCCGNSLDSSCWTSTSSLEQCSKSIAVVDDGVCEHAAEDDPRRGSATHAGNDVRNLQHKTQPDHQPFSRHGDPAHRARRAAAPVDAPQEEHLLVVRRGSVSVVAPSPQLEGERTPLLAADKVDAILDEEEKAAVAADNQLATWDIARVETKRLLAVAFPMMLAVVLEMLPDLALSIMVGHTDVAHSTQILAAYQLSGLVQMMIIGGLIMGLSSAIDMCSHAFGAKRMTELWRITQAATVVYVLCLPFIVIVLSSGKPMLVAMGQDPDIADVAGRLLAVSMLLVPFCIMYAVMKSALQAQNIVLPFVLASLVSFILSSIAAYVLAFHTSLGYIGVALGSPVGWLLKVVMVLPVVLRNRVFVESWPGWDWSEAWARVPSIGRLGVSSVLMMTFQMVGFSFISLLAGMLPNAHVLIAANGIFVSVLGLAFMPLLGICIAGAIRMGNALGAGQARRARLISLIVMSASLSVSGVAAGIVAYIAAPYARAFTPNAEATSVATDLIKELLPLLPLLGFAFGMQSVFRACGKQLLCAQLNFVCLFVLGVPLGLVFAIQFDAGIAGLWAGNMAGTIIFAVAGACWLRSTSWEKMAHDAKHGARSAEFDDGVDIAVAA